MTDVELERLWNKADRSMRKNDLESASRTLKKLLLDQRYNPAIHTRLGIVYTKKGWLWRATRQFRLAAHYNDKYFRVKEASIYHNLGLIYYERGSYGRARDAFLEALRIEKVAGRYISLAKAEEKLGNIDNVLKYLAIAAKIDSNKVTKTLWLQTLSAQKDQKTLTKEVIGALQHNLAPWNYEEVEEYISSISTICEITEFLDGCTSVISNRGLSARTTQTIELAIFYIHNVHAARILLQQNYSHSAFVIARSLVETYLKSSYALQQKTYRGYAEVEKQNLISKIRANDRLIKKLTDNDEKNRLRKINRILESRFKFLNRRYKNLANLPSLRQIALSLDNSAPSLNYWYYSQCYEKGSDITHLDSGTIKGAIKQSGTDHIGLFTDTYSLTLLLVNLSLSLGEKLVNLPESPKYLKNEYKKLKKELDRIKIEY